MLGVQFLLDYYHLLSCLRSASWSRNLPFDAACGFRNQSGHFRGVWYDIACELYSSHDTLPSQSDRMGE